MTPSLIAEIRDVLRDFAREAEYYGDLRPDDSVATVLLSQLRRARSLLSRIEAQGEAPVLLMQPVGGWHEPGASDMPSAYESVPSVTTNSTDAPASADQGSGRARDPEDYLGFAMSLDQWAGWIEEAQSNPDKLDMADIDVAELRSAARRLRDAASEYSRGEAAGRLSGIEEAAKVCDGRERVMVSAVVAKEHRGADPTVAVAKRDMASELAAAIRQRALTTGYAASDAPKAEVDPNAWAFKHGLEST